MVAYGSAALYNQGWKIHGGGAAATKSTFNLLGGYVEFDIDVTAVHTGVNANIYTISPTINGYSFNQTYYCDGAKTGSSWCVEADWVESNGNCGGATTLHTVDGTGTNGCTSWGCSSSYHYSGRTSYHVRAEYAVDGKMTVIHDGKTISPSNYNPIPGTNDWNALKNHYQTRGAVIYSSQWTGWVPVTDCGTIGDLTTSTFSISNLKIYGSVVQGSAPHKC
jgi:hypothetical protein